MRTLPITITLAAPARSSAKSGGPDSAATPGMRGASSRSVGARASPQAARAEPAPPANRSPASAAKQAAAAGSDGIPRTRPAGLEAAPPEASKASAPKLTQPPTAAALVPAPMLGGF